MMDLPSETSDARRAPGLPGEAVAARMAAERNLVMVRQPGWQSEEDWQTIARHVRDLDPRIETFVVNASVKNSYSRRRAAERPSLIFSPGPLRIFRPIRGKAYHGRQISKLEQMRRLTAGGVAVPRATYLTAELKLDPDEWGEFVILKPSDPFATSYGKGIQLIRTRRVRYLPPDAYPDGHPGRLGPMIVQKFVDTGDRISLYRVLTLFGEPMYAQLSFGVPRRVDLNAPDEEIESAVVATQAVDKERHLVDHADALAVARAAHAAIPEVPLKGCDIIREAETGKLYVLEVNPGSNTWHFSSDFLAEHRRRNGPEHEARRLAQFDALRAAARVLVERTNAEAE